MNQSVSTRSTFAIASVLSMSILWVVFVLPATGVVSGGLGLLTLASAIWVGMLSTRSMAQVIRDIDAEPVPVTSIPAKSVL